MAYQTLDVEPLAGAMGAVIHGVDLSGELSNQAFDEIHQAFLDHKAIFFHDQNLDPHQQIAFGRRFGPMGAYPFMEGLPEAPERRSSFGPVDWASPIPMNHSAPFSMIRAAQQKVSTLLTVVGLVL